MNKVAIVGGSEDTRDLAPYNDLSCEIWSVAPRYMNYDYLKRVTRLFELHPRKGFDPFYLDFLRTINIPVYMQKVWSDFPTSVEFPIREILERDDWYINTFSMLISFAAYLRFDEVTLYGIEVEHDWEYQWDCLCYQARKARKKGTAVVFFGIEKEETPPIYGYQYARCPNFRTLFVFPDDIKDVDLEGSI